VVEVYPAGALALWGLPHKGYKANSGLSAADARKKRIATMASLERQAGAWLVLSEDVREACIDGDDAFDAFIASLVACAAATDSTFKPLVAERGAAQREGWIHLPQPGLAGLSCAWLGVRHPCWSATTAVSVAALSARHAVRAKHIAG
jgi:hypothetical protein